MTEPKVGMGFSTYKTETARLGKPNYVKNDSYTIKPEGTYDLVFKSKNTKDGFNWTQLDVNRGGKNKARVTAGIDPHGLCREGVTNHYAPGKDVKYTRIIGENTYAVDKNGNGIVDKGEIHKVTLQCGVADNDEKLYHINTAI